MYRHQAVSLALIGLFVWTTACTSYTQIQLGEVADHGKVRVTLADSSTMGMFSPHLQDGSLVGNSIAERSRSVTVPLDQIAHIEAERTDGAKTALLVIGIVGVLVIAYAIDCSNNPKYGCP